MAKVFKSPIGGKQSENLMITFRLILKMKSRRKLASILISNATKEIPLSFGEFVEVF